MKHMLQLVRTLKTLCQVKEARHKKSHFLWFLSMKYPEQANIQRQKVKVTLPGDGRGQIESDYVMNTQCFYGVMKHFRN